jgi:hypothetical protein
MASSRSSRRTMIVLVLAVALVAGPAGVARACSCAPQDPRKQLDRSAAAFVGTFLHREEKEPPEPGQPIDSGRPMIYTFRVDEEIKEELGDTVEVISAAEGPSCGLEVTEGQQIGLFLDSIKGEWHASLCDQIDPDELREAAQPLPEPDGEGPIALLAGASMGDVRTVALDNQGRTLAYGEGDGVAVAIAVCPGSLRAVELVFRWPRPMMVAVRNLRTMRVVRETRLQIGGRGSRLDGLAAGCRGRFARSAYVFATDQREPRAGSRILKIVAGEVSRLHVGTGRHATFTRRRAFLSAGRFGRRAVSVNLDTGRARLLGRGPRNLGPLSRAPGGDFLAGVAFGTYRDGRVTRSRAVLFDLRHRPATVRSVRIEREAFGEMLWRNRRRIVFLGNHGGPRSVRVFDLRLRTRSAFGGWAAASSALVGPVAYGIGGGSLLRARLPEGPTEIARIFPTPTTHSLAAVPGRVFVRSN